MERFIQTNPEKERKSTSVLNPISFKDKLNKEQLNVVNHIKGPMIVIAGAGSGKTRTISFSVAKLILLGIKPSEIMLVTFTNKASKEMLKRVENLLGKQPNGIWGGTFHSLANRFIRMYTYLAGLKPRYSIIDQTDAYLLIKHSIENIFPNYKLMNLPNAKQCYKILSYSINCNSSIKQVLEWKFPQFSTDLVFNLKKIFKEYAKEKIRNNLVDFDDLLVLWNKLLDEKLIAKKIAEKIKYILVDEYQDTNFIQAEIILKIAKVNQNMMVVGDDAQSIYSFRGANFKNLLNFGDHFRKIEKYKITYNYRSTPEILALANNSINHNINQFQKKMIPVKRSINKPKYIIVATEEDQAKYIANEILKCKKNGTEFTEIAILYRSNYHSLRLQKELQKVRIPFEVRSGLSFFEQAHIKDVIAHFKIIFNPFDRLAWNRLFLLIPGLGRKSANKILDLLEDSNDPLNKLTETNYLHSRLIGNRISHKTIRNIAHYFKNFEKFSPESNPSLMFKPIKSLIQNYIKKRYENYEERLKDINALYEFSLDFNSIEDFLDNLNLNETEISDSRTTKSANKHLKSRILLSTIHKAKGLEWKIVFILSLSETLFPAQRINDDNIDIEEERRIFYVALTRAKEELYLISPKIVKSFQGIKLLEPSRFITELNEDLYELIDYSNSLVENLDFENIEAHKQKFLPKFTTADELIRNDKGSH